MYCPRCSQQQVSDDVSFCTRCGFQLGVVKELLVTGGTFPSRAAELRSGQLLPGQKGVRLGTKIIFFSIILLPLFFGISYFFDSPNPFWVPAIIFLAGLASVLYSSIFSEDILPAKLEAPSAFSKRIINPQVGELTATRINTAEMIQPPSITEPTTNLLRAQDRKRV
jgi:hypothetical protein